MSNLPDTPSPAGVVAAWQRAWNLHDMALASELVAADVDFITVRGVWLRGRAEFRTAHVELHRLQMRDSVWTTLGHDCRELAGGLSLAHVEWGIDGDRDPDGRPRLPRRGHFSWVLRQQADGRWLIVAGQNTNLAADARLRLAAAGGRP